MPDAQPDETRDEWMERCIPKLLDEGTAKDSKQASAICADMWRRNKEERKTMDNALKTVDKTDDELRVANYMILFDTKDLSGEHFARSVDIESRYTKMGALPVDWEHGLNVDGEVGPPDNETLGFVDWKTAKRDDTGVWVERVLDRRNKYVTALEELIEQGMIGNSSEALPRMVEALRGKIVRWPLAADTLTVMPMEPKMMTDNVVGALRSAANVLPGIDAVLRQATEDSKSVDEELEIAEEAEPDTPEAVGEADEGVEEQTDAVRALAQAAAAAAVAITRSKQ